MMSSEPPLAQIAIARGRLCNCVIGHGDDGVDDRVALRYPVEMSLHHFDGGDVSITDGASQLQRGTLDELECRTGHERIRGQRCCH
jgi:hypothetical protein